MKRRRGRDKDRRVEKEKEKEKEKDKSAVDGVLCCVVLCCVVVCCVVLRCIVLCSECSVVPRGAPVKGVLAASTRMRADRLSSNILPIRRWSGRGVRGGGWGMRDGEG